MLKRENLYSLLSAIFRSKLTDLDRRYDPRRFIERELKMLEAIDRERRDLIRNLKKLSKRYDLVMDLEHYRVNE